MNWWLAFHVEEGKKDVNFSKFGIYSADRQTETFEAIANTVERGEMPFQSYLWMHKAAKLSARQKQLLINWARVAQQEVNRT